MSNDISDRFDEEDPKEDKANRPCAIGPDGTFYYSIEEIDEGYFEHQYQRENAYDEFRGQ